MLIICNQAKRDDVGIVPYGDIGKFRAFLSYSGTGGFRVFSSYGVIGDFLVPTSYGAGRKPFATKL